MKNDISSPKAALILHGRRITPVLGKSAVSTAQNFQSVSIQWGTAVFHVFVFIDRIAKLPSDIFFSVPAADTKGRVKPEKHCSSK